MASFINEATWDRVIRILLGVVLLYVGWAGVVGGTAGTVLKLFGFLPLLTGVFGWCAVYQLFGVTTCKRPA